MSAEVCAAPERWLPANPNAIVFAADAAVVFDRRSDRQILELGLGPAEALARAAGSTVAVGFGGRSVVDRRNRRSAQVVMFVVVDGPLSEAAFDVLERTVAHNPVAWSPSRVERAPAGALVWWVSPDERPRLLVRSTPDGLRVGTVARGGDHVNTAWIAVEALGVPDAALAVGCVPPYSDADRAVERMRFAFARDVARQIVEADGVVREGERQFMEQVFGVSITERLGIADPAEQARCLEAALEQLPVVLGHHDKLALVGVFFSACCADGGLDAREVRVLKDAANALGLDRANRQT